MTQDRTHTLTDVELAMAEAFAVIHPHRPARSKVMTWVNRVRKLEGLKSFKQDEWRLAYERLVDLQVLLPSVSGRGVVAAGPMIRSGNISRYCLSAINYGRAHPLLDVLEQAEFSSGYRHSYLPGAVQSRLRDQQLRLAILSANAADMAEINPTDLNLGWVTETEAMPFLHKLPDALRQMVYASGVDTIVRHLWRSSGFLSRALDNAPHPEQLLDGICLVLLLRGEFEHALSLCGSVADRGVEQRVVVRVQLLVQSTIALMQGDYVQAQSHLQACLEHEREGTRKKIAVPEGYLIDFAMLSLVGRGDPQASALFRSLQTKRFGKRQPFGVNLVYTMARSVEDLNVVESPYRLGQTRYYVDVLLALASCWHGAYAISPREQRYIELLQQLLQHTARNGYAWVCAELLTVLEQPDIGETQLTSHTVGLVKEASASERHQQLGTRSLAGLIAKVERWEADLLKLERLKPAATSAKTSKRVRAGSKTRLLWRVKRYEHHLSELFPVQQKLDANQRWSKGRNVSLQRLHEQTGEFDFLLEQDRQAAATIRKVSYGSWTGAASRYEISDATAFHLIGHPYVEDDEGNSVEVLERPLRLSVLESGEGEAAVLILKLDPPFMDGAYLSRFDASGARLEVTHATAEQRRLRDVIPLDGMVVPSHARERLLDIVAHFAGVVQIQSDAEAAGSNTVSGNAAPVLELELIAEGLSVRTRVEPLPDSNVLFDCASGGEVVYVQAAGSQPGPAVGVKRDFELEKQQLLQLVDTAGVLAAHYDGTPFLTIDSIADALELLEQLQLCGARCIWPRGEALKITQNADDSQLRVSIKSAEEWFASSGELKVDGRDAIALHELLQLTRMNPQSRFIEVGKGQYLALSEKLQQQLRVLSAFSDSNLPLPDAGSATDGSDDEASSNKQLQQKSKRQTKKGSKKPAETDVKLHPLALLALAPMVEADNRGDAAGGIRGDKAWRSQLALARRALHEPAALPTALDADLRSYQHDGYQWLMQLGAVSSLGGGGIGACLADDMGLGKTVQTLALLLSRAAGGPALVVAPTSVVGNWVLEAQRFAPSLSISPYGQSGYEREALLEAPAAFDVIVVSYGLLHSDADAFAEVKWHTVVLDEAQAIKNATTQRAKTARRLQAEYRVATTGTPVQNNLMDLHSLFEFLNPGLLGSRQQFHRRYAIPIERDGDAKAIAELQLLTAPFILRRRKRDVLQELPTRTEINLQVELSSDEAALYESMRLEALEQLSSDELADKPGKRKFEILAQLTRLRRLCCNPLLVESGWTGSQSKRDLFNTTLQELLANNHKVLVFSQYVDHLKLIETELQRAAITFQYLDGSTPAKQRQQRVAAFQQGQGDVFLISLTAGGTGLNLTAADYVIHLDPWWNPAVEDQASDRAHRIGQKRPVTIYRMVTKGTVEAQIIELHGHKRNLAKSILTGTDNSRVEPEQLLALLSQPIA